MTRTHAISGQATATPLTDPPPSRPPLVTVIAPVLPEDVRQYILTLQRTGSLNQVVSGWVPRRKMPAFLGRIRGLHIAVQRDPLEVDPSRLHIALGAEIAERYARRRYRSAARAGDARFLAVDRLGPRFMQGSTVVMARENACLHTFTAARQAGISCVLDLPNPHIRFFQTWMEQEYAAYPDIEIGGRDPFLFQKQRVERKLREYALADRILVPSTFASQTLLEEGVQAATIWQIPFGTEVGWVAHDPSMPRRKLFLYVGQISMRKGVHRLLAVWKNLGLYRTHRLLLIGAMRLTPLFLRSYQGVFEHIPQLPRAALLPYYQQAQALVLNSVAEGFGLVISEALSCGTPVIASRHTGAPDLLTDGREGLLIEACNDTSLATALEQAASAPERMAEMGRAALRTAASWPWASYQRRLEELLRTQLS